MSSGADGFENRAMTATETPTPAVASATRYVYDFAEGSRDMRVLLGGKGANIAEMTRVLGADLVPAGFTITTEACVAFMRDGRAEPAGLAEQVADGIARLEERAGRRARRPRGSAARVGALRRARLDAGDARDDPRPRTQRRVGARPGRAHRRRALRLGLLPALRADVRQRRARRAGRALRGDPARRAPPRRRARGPRARAWRSCASVTRRFRTLYEAHTGEPFPQDPQEQLRLAIRAVFDSWLGDRAVAYRRINHIPDDWGTAVNVQQMVFGNRGAGSATGVAFSRDELTGAPEPSGDFLLDAQGEDVVSGVRTPRPLHELAERAAGGARASCCAILRTLEAHYGDMQDTEFTVERGRLYMLQTRSAKRPAQAAVRFAVDAVDEGLLTREQALRDDRRRRAGRAAAPDVRSRTRASRCSRAASPPRPARPRARSSSPPRRRSPPPRRAAT